MVQLMHYKFHLFHNLFKTVYIVRPTDYVPKSNSQQKNTPDAHTRCQQVGAERRGARGIA